MEARHKKHLPITTPPAWGASRELPTEPLHARVDSIDGAPDEVPTELEDLRQRVVAKLKTIYDPEIPVNLFDLGLIYAIEIDETHELRITMTLTAPACPVAASLVKEVADRTAEVPGIKASDVKVVWDPPWTKDRMTEAAKLELGFL